MLNACGGFYLLSRHLESNLLDLMRCCNSLILLAPRPPPTHYRCCWRGRNTKVGAKLRLNCQRLKYCHERRKNYCSRLIIRFDLANNWEEKGQLPNLCFRLWFGGYGRETSTLNRVVRILALFRQISWLMFAVQF